MEETLLYMLAAVEENEAAAVAIRWQGVEIRLKNSAGKAGEGENERGDGGVRKRAIDGRGEAGREWGRGRGEGWGRGGVKCTRRGHSWLAPDSL